MTLIPLSKEKKNKVLNLKYFTEESWIPSDSVGKRWTFKIKPFGQIFNFAILRMRLESESQYSYLYHRDCNVSSVM